MAGAPAHRLPYLLHASSPHARGTLAHLLPSADELRFIPAWAGNARCPVAAETSSTVHPRIRGERRAFHVLAHNLGGSSPHARGTRSVFKTVLHRDRFIPACAGNANWRFRARCVGTVHPRMRGERGKCSRCPHVQRGSSPHARGTQRGRTAGLGLSRFIPACAGNAGRPGLSGRSRPVHPRMRGERRGPGRSGCQKSGSSPHARGTHFQ